jgi:hypothetical protein
MGTRSDETNGEVTRRLTATLPPGSPNEITAAELRAWAVEYLRDYDAELSRFPELVGNPHWNLWMMDVRLEDAMFAALVFRPGGVEFFCGTGEAFAIKQFADSDFPDDVEQLRAEMVRRFVVPESSLLLGREEAEAWLGRGW